MNSPEAPIPAVETPVVSVAASLDDNPGWIMSLRETMRVYYSRVLIRAIGRGDAELIAWCNQQLKWLEETRP